MDTIKFPKIGIFANADDYNYFNISNLIGLELSRTVRLYAYIDQVPYIADDIFMNNKVDTDYLAGFGFDSNYARSSGNKIEKVQTVCIFVSIKDEDDEKFRKSMLALKRKMLKNSYNYEETCKTILNEKYMSTIDLKHLFEKFIIANKK